MLRKLIFIAMLAGVSSIWTAHAQQPVHIVRGQVLDAQTGESLPSANIRIEGTYRGTITNAEGVFEIAIQEVPADLVFRYIGYETQRRAITDRSMQRIEVRMQPTTYQMPELVVTDENPAIGIMRCVIDRKQERRALLSSYASEAYTRFTVSNDTSIVAIIETLSEVFWDKEQGMRELVKSRRQTSNLGIELTDYLPAALFVANLYDDDIPLVGYNFVGVTHPNALDIYRFSLQGTRLIDDLLVYDITVAPKSQLNTAFSGEIAVLADECALLEVALEPGEAFLFPPPVTGIAVTLYQQYDSFDESAWLPVDFRSDLGVDISFGPLLTFPTFKIRQVSRITDYQIEAVLPDSLYAEGKYLGIDQEAIAADTLLDRAGVAVPFEEPERVAYAGIDSTMTLEKAFEPTGLLMRLPGQTDAQANEDGETEEPGFLSGFLSGTEWVQPRLRFNRVEGFHGGLSAEYESERFYVEGGGGWSVNWRIHGRTIFRAKSGSGRNDMVSSVHLTSTGSSPVSDRNGTAPRMLPYTVFSGAEIILTISATGEWAYPGDTIGIACGSRLPCNAKYPNRLKPSLPTIFGANRASLARIHPFRTRRCYRLQPPSGTETLRV